MEYISNSKITLWSKIFTFLIVFFPILDIYAVGMKGISVGSLLLSVALIRVGVNFFMEKRAIKWNPYFIFFYYGIFISFFTIFLHNEFSISNVLIRLTYFLFYTLLIFLPKKYDFNINYACKLYMKVGIAAGVFLLLQYICFFGFGYTLVGLIPDLPLNYSITDYSEWIDKYSNMYMVIFRPTSFFPEPASFAQFMTPLLILILFSKIGENRRLLKAVFISLVMVLSTSTNGIMFTAFAWAGYILYHNFSKIKRGHFPVLMVTICFILILTFVLVGLTDNPISNYTIQQFEGLLTLNESSSAYFRILRGFDIYSQLNFVEKIFGIGLGNYRSYYATGALHIFDGEIEYMSSLSYLFVSTGLIGFILYIYSLHYNSRKQGIVVKILAIWVLIVFSSSSLFNSPLYVLTYLFLLHFKEIEN